MFILHGSWLRKYMRWIFAGLLVVLIPGFVVLFTHTDTGDTAGRKLPTIRGKPVNRVEFDRARNAVVAQYLINSGGSLARSAELDYQILQETMLRVLCLQQAAAFQIRVSDAELIQYLQTQPFLRNEAGQFDVQRYQQFLLRLNNNRISEAEFEEVMRQQLTVLRLQALVASGAKATPLEVQHAYTPLHEKITIRYVTFDAASQPNLPAITDEAAQALYEKAKGNFRTTEKVNIRYVRVPFDAAAPQISDADVTAFYERNQAQYTNDLAAVQEEIRAQLGKSRAQSAAGNRATEVTMDLVFQPDAPRPQFATVAAKYNLPVTETGFFARGDEVPGVKAGEEFTTTAFALLPSAPFSDPVAGEDGYYVLELVERQKSEIMPFADAKPQVVALLQKEQALAAAVQAGQEAARKLKELVAAGKTFDAAAAELQLTPQTAAPFTLAADKLDIPGDMAVREATLGLPVGAVSDLIRTAQGGLVFYLQDRQPPDPAQFEKDKPGMTTTVLNRNRETMWDAWLNAVWRDEQVDLQQPRPQPAAQDEES